MNENQAERLIAAVEGIRSTLRWALYPVVIVLILAIIVAAGAEAKTRTIAGAETSRNFEKHFEQIHQVNRAGL